jgi:hypothetical protein
MASGGWKFLVLGLGFMFRVLGMSGFHVVDLFRRVFEPLF